MARRSGAAGSDRRGPGPWTASASARRRACRPGRPEALEVGEQREDSAEALARVAIVSEPGDPQVLVHREGLEDPLTLGTSRSRAVRRRRGQAVVTPSNRTAPRRGGGRSSPCGGSWSARAVPAEEHGHPVRPDAEGDALEDVVLADVDVDVLELEEWRHARAAPPEVGGLDLGVPGDSRGGSSAMGGRPLARRSSPRASSPCRSVLDRRWLGAARADPVDQGDDRRDLLGTSRRWARRGGGAPARGRAGCRARARALAMGRVRRRGPLALEQHVARSAYAGPRDRRRSVVPQATSPSPGGPGRRGGRSREGEGGKMLVSWKELVDPEPGARGGALGRDVSALEQRSGPRSVGTGRSGD